MKEIIPPEDPGHSPPPEEQRAPEVSRDAAQQTLREVCAHARKILDIWSPYSRGSDIVPTFLAILSLGFSIVPHIYLYFFSPELIKPPFLLTSLITWLLTAGLGQLALEEVRNAFRVRRRLEKFPTNIDSSLIEEIKKRGREYIDSASTIFLVWFFSESISYELDITISMLSTKNNLPEGPKIYLLLPLFIVNMLLPPILLSQAPSSYQDRTVLEEACQKFIREKCNTKKTMKS